MRQVNSNRVKQVDHPHDSIHQSFATSATSATLCDPLRPFATLCDPLRPFATLCDPLRPFATSAPLRWKKLTADSLERGTTKYAKYAKCTKRRLVAEVLSGLDEEAGTTNLRYPTNLTPGDVERRGLTAKSAK